MSAGFEPDPDCPYDQEPPCTGRYTDVDEVDECDCEFHDPNSHWNRWRRAWDAAHEEKPSFVLAQRAPDEILTDDDCPF